MFAKKIKLYPIVIIMLLLPVSAMSNSIPEGIVKSIQTGNAKELSSFFNSTLELTLSNKEEIYSKTQAEIILRDFFKSNTPVAFKILHQGGKENSKYAIGNLSTSGENFRITILLKQKNNIFYIHQLHIEKDEVE